MTLVNKNGPRILFYGFVALTFAAGLLLSLLGGHLITRWEHTWGVFFARMIEHGGEIIGVIAVLSLVSERLAQLTIITIFSEELSQKIRRLVFEDRPGVEASGLVGIVGQMDFGSLFKKLECNDELFWLDTYAPGVKLWIQDVEDAARKGATLNFLILSPESDLARMRAREIGRFFSPENFVKELQGFGEVIQEASKGHQNVHLRYYKDLLGCPIYLVRREGKPYWAFSSLYLGKATGAKFPHFEWSNPATLTESEVSVISALDDYVNAKWERAIPAAIEKPGPEKTAAVAGSTVTGSGPNNAT
jgi:hypothetical protein